MTDSHHPEVPSHRPRALEGVRVLDVTQFMAGPFCAMLLADLGADVIKVEPPSGDSTRQMVGAVGTESPAFNAVNRGKRSLVLNLKSPDGRQLFKRLAVRPRALTPQRLDELAVSYAPTIVLPPEDS